MKRARLIASGLLLTLRRSPAGAQPARVYRVSILSPVSSAHEEADEEAFLRALSGLGYRPGKNLEIIHRTAAGDATRIPQLAAELVRAKPDVIVAAGGQQVIRALKHATTTVPIVMAGAPDPVGYGYIASLARPGGNITGVTSMARDLTGKRIQLLEELVPHLRRIAVVLNPAQPGNVAFWDFFQSTASKLGIATVAIDIRSPEEVAHVTSAIARQHVDGISVFSNPTNGQNAAELVRAIGPLRLPAIYQDSDFIASGGLLYYGASDPTMWGQVATYVARILKGANPAELPVEQPTTFDLVVNLKTAHALGITVPQSILLQATQVIR